MPVRINKELPAYSQLTQENIFVMSEQRAVAQDIRPLKLAILNIMPTKIVTETQLLRLLGNTPLQIDVTFLRTSSHNPKNTPLEHLESFYRTFEQIRDQKFDGLIITGAPVEKLEFNEVRYWDELTAIMNWSKKNVYSTMHICWGAQAGLFYNYGIEKHVLDKKLSGIFLHKTTDSKDKLIRGFNDYFYAPHSRYTGIDRQDVDKHKELTVLAQSDKAGVYLIVGREGREVYVTGHPEYDNDTLALEYRRDTDKGISPDLPENYFPDNDPNKEPVNLWRGHANLLFSNWLNYCVYQETPYILDDIG